MPEGEPEAEESGIVNNELRALVESLGGVAQVIALCSSDDPELRQTAEDALEMIQLDREAEEAATGAPEVADDDEEDWTGDGGGGGSPVGSLDVPEQIDPIVTPRVAMSTVREPEPESELPPISRAASLAQGGMMGLGPSVVFFNHERAEASGGVEELAQRRRVLQESEKDRATFALLEDVLAEHWLTARLTQDLRAELVDSMLRRVVAPGGIVVARDQQGSDLLILGSGHCEAGGADAESDDDDQRQEQPVASKGGLTRAVEPGDCMGAAMLVMSGHAHVVTVRATTPSVVWSLSRARFQDLVHSRTGAALRIRIELLQACPWLGSLDHEQLGRLAAVGRLHCCPVGARSVFDRAPAQKKPRCRYVLEEPDEGPDDFDWAGDAHSQPREAVYDYQSAGPLPTAGSVRPLRPQALSPLAECEATVLVERISEGEGDGGNGRELQLLAISGGAFSWLLGVAVSAELQAAITKEYPMTPEEAEAEHEKEMERAEEALAARIEAEKVKKKGPPRPSAAAMSMASALANYGATPSAAKSSPQGVRRGKSNGGHNHTRLWNKGGQPARPDRGGGTFEELVAAAEPPHAGILAEQERIRTMAQKLAEKEKARRVEQIQMASLEFFTPSHLGQTQPSPQDDDSDDDAGAAEEEEGRSFFNAGRLAYQAPSHEDQAPRYLKVQATSKTALCALGAERRWLHSLRLWAELPSSPGLLALAGAGESKRHLYNMTEWDGGESLATAAARGVGGGMGSFRLKRKAVAFYTAQIIGALDVLHGQRVVYRSLTPASLLLDCNGNIQLGSFGLAKQLGVGVNAKTYTLCGGALGYLAPEQLQHIGHGTAVDHWAVGVLLCELLTGAHPFSPALCSFGDGGDAVGSNNAAAAQEVEDQVNDLFSGGDVEAGMQHVLLGQWSSTAMAARLAATDADAADLIGSLLTVDPADRPCTAGRTAALVSHPWFAARLGDNLGAVIERTATAPLAVRGAAARPPKPGSGVFGDFWRVF